MQQFSELDISFELKQGIKDLGYVTPTDFQRGVFEGFAHGKNVFGMGQSNYGKSLAFSLPILSKIDPNINAVQALIICETNMQSDLWVKECRALGRHINLVVGNTKSLEHAEKPHIVVGSFIDIANLKIDEITESVKTVFFDGLSSASMAKAIELLTNLFNRGIQVLIFGQEAVETCKTNSHQAFDDAVIISNNDQPKIVAPAVHIFHQAKDTEPKPKALLAALLMHKPKFALVTVNESQECDLLARYLTRHGFKSLVVSEDSNRHGFKDSINDGLSGLFDVLLCQNTLMAGQQLEHVGFMINYDMVDRPQVYEQITQFSKQAPDLTRTIVNIVSHRELGFLGPIKAHCLIPITEMPLPDHAEVMDMCVDRIMGKLKNEAQEVELGQYEEIAQKFLTHADKEQVLSFLLRNYLSMPVTKSSSHRRDSESRERRNGGRFQERNHRANKEHSPNHSVEAAPEAALEREVQQPVSQDGISRLYLTLGRKDGFSDLTDLAQYVSELSKVDIGHFSGGGMIRETSAHIEVDDDVAEEVIKALHESLRPHAQEGDAPVICEHAKGPTRDRFRPRSRHPQQRRRHNNSNYQRRH